MIPLLKAAISHKGFALVDIISPCVTFNDHSESTKSYAHTRQHYHQAVHVDYVESQKEITTKYAAGESVSVDMHDGSKVLLRKIDKEYNPTDRLQALNHIHKHQAQGEIVTGLLYINDHEPDLHALNDTSETPLRDLPYSQLSPGRKGIEKVNSKYR